jgi:hypothetical protein
MTSAAVLVIGFVAWSDARSCAGPLFSWRPGTSSVRSWRCQTRQSAVGSTRGWPGHGVNAQLVPVVGSLGFPAAASRRYVVTCQRTDAHALGRGAGLMKGVRGAGR